jgi:hypothetical protein
MKYIRDNGDGLLSLHTEYPLYTPIERIYECSDNINSPDDITIIEGEVVEKQNLDIVETVMGYSSIPKNTLIEFQIIGAPIIYNSYMNDSEILEIPERLQVFQYRLTFTLQGFKQFTTYNRPQHDLEHSDTPI